MQTRKEEDLKTSEQTSGALDQMTVEDMKREIYRLRHIRTDLQNKLKGKEAIISYLKTAQDDRMAKKVAEEVRGLIQTRGLRRI
jgi:hypothetical protein